MIKAVLRDEELKPVVGTEHSAGLDLKLDRDLVLYPGQTELVGTGLKIAIPEGHVGLVFPRSSMGKRGLALANTTGVIDADYRGEVMLMLTNRSNNKDMFFKGDRVAQLVIVPFLQPKVVYVKDLAETDRGEGGFGSTGA